MIRNRQATTQMNTTNAEMIISLKKRVTRRANIVGLLSRSPVDILGIFGVAVNGR